MKLKMLRDSGFFGRMLAVRGEFGYWVFEGDLQPIQRPSWNYRSEDGGGIILDMLCHWRYVLDHVFGAVGSLSCLGATHITKRWDEDGKPYEATAEDAAYATFMLEGGVVAQINSSWQTRVYRDDLVTFQVDGTHGSAVAGLQSCKIQQRMATPRPVWNPDEKRADDFRAGWQEVPDTQSLRERFPPSVGDVHPPRRRRTRVEAHAARRRQGRAARRAGGGELALAPLGRRAAALARGRTARQAGPPCRLSRPPCTGRGPPRSGCRSAAAAWRLTGSASRARFPPSRAARSTASPLPPRMWFPIRSPMIDPWLGAAIDWDATIAYRRHLWALGFSVAEAMDTAQRGMGLDWPTALELIRRSTAAAKAEGHRMLASGAGTDHLDPAAAKNLDDVIRAYEEQFEAVEAAGSPVILMASRALVRVARSADDYLKVYDRLLAQAREPVIIHWLGDMFDPQLAGYWGSPDIATAMGTALDAIAAHPDKVDGIKISLLDAAWEIEMRRRLPPGVRMYSGDDFNFAELIAGDDHGHSDALLGIFDAIAPAASAALSRLASGDLERLPRDARPDRAAVAPDLRRAHPLLQDRDRLPRLAERPPGPFHHGRRAGERRSVLHLSEIFRLADRAKLFSDPALAADRMRRFLAVHGVA